MDDDSLKYFCGGSSKCLVDQADNKAATSSTKNKHEQGMARPPFDNMRLSMAQIMHATDRIASSTTARDIDVQSQPRLTSNSVNSTNTTSTSATPTNAHGMPRRNARISFLRGALQKHHQSICGGDDFSYMSKSQTSMTVDGTDSHDDSVEHHHFPSTNETRIQMLVKEMEHCLSELNCTATSQELESWACIIYESMSAPSRTFHSVQHVFDVAVGADCIQKMAAFFHDIIYYSIDGGLSKVQHDMLRDIITESNGVVAITEEKLDKNMSMTIDIFGFKSGQILDKFRGLNEFLSASTAVRCYQGNMDAKLLVAIVACIEATIPFRREDALGRCPAEALFDRLVKINITYGLDLTEDDLVKIVQRAVDLGNRDLANFCTPEHAVFLSNTWNLLPESNISLRNNRAFRISDFAFALKKMTDFFESLDPQLIYLSFRESEGRQRFLDEKTEIAKDNIKVALKYMFCKGIAIGVVAAIAELTGGDAPLALFLGDLPERDHVSTSVEDHIHIHSTFESVELDEGVFQLLLNGREAESNFDIKNSPLAAYLYALMGDEGIERCAELIVHPMDEDHAQKLLEAIPALAAIDILNACAKIAVTRTSALNKIRASFEEKLQSCN